MFASLHDSHSLSFASDNYAGVHPQIMAALAAANGGHVSAYGSDPYTGRLQALIRRHFGEQAQAWPVFNGTGANVLGLQALLPRWGAVVCAESAHIHQDENAAPQAVGGLKLWTVPTPDGKLTPELVAQQAHGWGNEHRAQPLAVYLSQSTECGTCYRIEEIRAIADYAHAHGMALFMDGARLANAAAFLGCDLKTLSTEAGVDLLSFGGTKNGLMFGECLVVCRPEAVAGLAYLRKINLQLASKMRFISAQFIALLEDGLWRQNAEHANRMAQRLAEGLRQYGGADILYAVEANAVFAKLPPEAVARARGHFDFYDWDQHGTVRLMCSFDTQAEHVDALLAAICG
ncbi:MAG: low specificity L-threonine aldolase [Eikenella sp.]|nr:low specificity L-threonine aldolase [Eikenella sp.]